MVIELPLSSKTYLFNGSTNPWLGKSDGTIINVTTDINSILNVVPTNEEVWLAKGEYPCTSTIALKTGVQIYGSFVGTEETINDRELQDLDNGIVEAWEFKFPTIIKGVGKAGTAVSYTLFNSNYYFTLNGITIDGHNTTNSYGGAIYSNARPIISQCIIRNIKNAGNGAGIYSNAVGGVLIRQCLIENCESVNGAAVYIGRKASIFQSVLRNNSATNGGAIYVNGGTDSTNSNYITNNVIYNNTASNQGGGICIADNDNTSSTYIIHNTIVNNLALANTGGIVGLRAGTSLHNNVVYNNFEGSSLSNVRNLRSTLTNTTLDVKNSAFNGGLYNNTALVYGSNNIVSLTSPSFISTSTSIGSNSSMTNDVRSANFAIQSNSQLKDAGVSVSFAPTVDFVGNVRPCGSTVDIGAYEYFSGTQTLPIATFNHLFIYGQSLSVGYQSYPTLSTQNLAGNYMIGDQVWKNYGNNFNFTQFSPLVGNIDNAEKSNANIMNRSSTTSAECPLIAAANHIQLKVPGENILASSCGTGGRTIEQLSKESELNSYYSLDFLSALYSANEISKYNNYKINCPAIFWLQGENNYGVVTTPGGVGLTTGANATGDKAEYKAFLIKLKDNMQRDIQNVYQQQDKPLFITYQVGAQYSRGKELPIGMAQLEASNEYSDVICAGPVYPMTDRGGHLDSNGYRWYGEMLGKVYFETKVLNKVFKPLQPISISRTGLSNQLRIKYNVVHLPLVLDELTTAKATTYGFEMWLNNVKQTISSVSIDGDCVLLTASAALVGDVEVIYAGSNTSGSGNLRDSDSYQAFYNYIDLDKKNSDGSFFFPRDATETTLRPSYEPKDLSSKVIYDKPYPLYNFSVAYYYKMLASQITINIGAAKTTDLTENYENKDLTMSQSNGFIILTNRTNHKAIFKLFTASGQFLKSGTIVNESTQISLMGLSNGLYLLKLEQNGIHSTHKIILNN